MAAGKDKNYVSIWFWMLVPIVLAIPCFGWVMIVVWAFMGENESRKNYFRAILVWTAIFFVIWAGVMLFGFWPEIQKLIAQLADWLKQRVSPRSV